MDIIISQRLKELRAQKGNTQEELANYLSISAPAVSKWERGEGLPDLTLVPKIAAYYDVTVDDLLGVGETRKRERLEQYRSESQKLQNVGKIAESVALWRKAKNEFPNDLSVLFNLAFALCFQNGSGEAERYKEAIELDERILRESTDQRQRTLVIERLCRVYYALGEKDKALEYADMADSLFHSSELMKLDILEGEEKEQLAKGLVVALTTYLCITVRRMKSVDPLCKHEFIIGLLEYVYSDGFMGFAAGQACDAHYFCAAIYADSGQEEKVRHHLEQLVRYAKQEDSLHGEIVFHSELLSGLKQNADTMITNTEKTSCDRYWEFLTGKDRHEFDKYRDTDWFQAVVKELGQQ